jgi:hypothetical protein
MTRNSCATLTLATLAALGLSATTAHAQTLAYWNFDTQGTPSFSATVGANPSLAVTSGVDSSSASMGFTGFTNNGQDGTPAFAFILPGANTPGTSTASTAALRLASGNDTAQNNGSALFWKASTAGYSSIVVNYDTQQSSSSTFQTQTFEYSTDGGTTFTPVSSITPPTAYATQSFNLSSIPGIANNPNAAFEIVFSGAPVYTGTAAPNNRIDNVTVTGVVAPEPSSAAGMVIGTGVLGLLVARRRKAVQA